jgi:hypothetical protein
VTRAESREAVGIAHGTAKDNPGELVSGVNMVREKLVAVPAKQVDPTVPLPGQERRQIAGNVLGEHRPQVGVRHHLDLDPPNPPPASPSGNAELMEASHRRRTLHEINARDGF